MASLSHAPFATPNTQQVPLPKSLPSHLSMDPSSSSSLSNSLNQQHSSSELSWLQKPSSKLSYINQLHTMQSSFNHQYSLSSSPLYEGYLEAAVDDPMIDKSFINGGGDDSLLTSSWEALDKLVSASMTPNSGSFNEFSDFAPASMHTQSSTSPSPISEVDQKPSNSPYEGSLWPANNHDIAHSRRASNVGLNLASLISADPGFVERAAKFSSYSQQQAFFSCLNQNNNNNNNVLSSDNVNLSNLYTSNSLSYIKCPPLHKGDNVAMEVEYAKSDITAQKPCNNTVSVNKSRSKSPQGSVITTTGSKKKREGMSMKEGEVDDDEANIVAGRWKRAKGGERKDEEEISNGNNMNRKVNKLTTKMQQAQSGGSHSGELPEQKSGGDKEILSSNKPCTNNNVSPKPDFIHVRARRGQATDSHSLAERVRREKISERMKYLQDLVPGCTKVTGKAMMLDEIINYVQSLQRQVEFLSMKLAAVPPSKLEFNFESLFGKEVGEQPIVQNNLNVSFAPETHHTDNLSSYPFPHENMQLQPSPAFPETNPSSSIHSFGSDAALRRTVSMLQAVASSDTFGECISQITDAWDNDFQNMVHLAGFVQTPQNTHPSLEGTLPPGQLKTEL